MRKTPTLTSTTSRKRVPVTMVMLVEVTSATTPSRTGATLMLTTSRSATIPTVTVNGEKPTLNYAKLGALLAEAANIVNDRPIGVKSITEDELVPL